MMSLSFSITNKKINREIKSALSVGVARIQFQAIRLILKLQKSQRLQPMAPLKLQDMLSYNLCLI